MNTDPFLRQVAGHFWGENGAGADGTALAELCFILPNRRSILFLQNYFKQLSGQRPILSPEMITINDFLYRLADEYPTDRVRLLLILYRCYKELRKEAAESLDEFIFWGDVLLGDFSDVDKYLLDPKLVFTNVDEYKSIDAGLGGLNKTQKDALDRFVKYFNPPDGFKRTGEHDARKPFKQIWNCLYPLYQRFNEELNIVGASYEGRAYRKACGRLTKSDDSAVDVLQTLFPRQKKFVFVGLTKLTACEQSILKQINKRPGLAAFCWDYPGDWIADKYNKSSFLQKNIDDFPQAFALQKLTGHPHVNVLPVASGVGQTRQIPAILKQCGLVKDQESDKNQQEDTESDSQTKVALQLESCAIVLPDEGLLMSVLNAIPEQIESINVTMGFPMAQSEFHSFLLRLMTLQQNVRWTIPATDAPAGAVEEARFYHKPVWDIFASPIFKLFYKKEPYLEEKVVAIQKRSAYYIPKSEFSGSEALEMIFRPVLDKPANPSQAASASTSAEPRQIKRFADYLKDVILYVGAVMSEEKKNAFETSFAKAAYNAIQQLASNELSIKPATFSRMVERLVSGLSIPFEGEPLNGLQVMGPLESRCLDFENLIVLSCNEGMFPRASVSSSFIPMELRVGFGLPSYEHQDEMWAYYFYRMIARAREVWLMYDNRTEGLKKGEESRFIKQLRYHFGADITDWAEHLPSGEENPLMIEEVTKTPQIMTDIRNIVYSPSSLESYVRCPMRFYFSHVLKLKVPTEVSEFLDNAMMGTVFHETMEALYTSEEAMKPGAELPEHPTPHRIDRGYLSDWLNRKEDIRKKVNSLICGKLKTMEVKGRNLVMAEAICQYALNVLAADIAYLTEKNTDAFTIISLEHHFNMNFLDVSFSGVVDRIDQVEGGKVRVVDYKTGRDEPECLGLNANKVDKPFSEYEYKAAIQFFLYDQALIDASSKLGDAIFPSSRSEIANAMYVPFKLSKTAFSKDYDVDVDFAEAMKDKLDALIQEINDASKPFIKKKSDSKHSDSCKNCDFRSICGE